MTQGPWLKQGARKVAPRGWPKAWLEEQGYKGII